MVERAPLGLTSLCLLIVVGCASPESAPTGSVDRALSTEATRFIATLVGSDASTAAFGDVDGDGDLDLAVRLRSELGSPGGVGVYRRDGDGFELWWESPPAGFVSALAWGDFDADGDPDLAIAGSFDRIRLFENQDGALEEVASLDVSVTGAQADIRGLDWGDFDGDGDQELAVAWAVSFQWISPQPWVLDVQGGELVPLGAGPFRPQTWVEAVAWGDADGDGDLDLAVGEGGTVHLLTNDGTDLVGVVESVDVDGIVADLAWGDSDGDGPVELAVVTRPTHPSLLSEQTLLEPTGGALLARWSELRPGSTSAAWGGPGGSSLLIGGRAGLEVLDGTLDSMRTTWRSPHDLRTDDAAWLGEDGTVPAALVLPLAVDRIGDDASLVAFDPTPPTLPPGIVRGPETPFPLAGPVACDDWDGDGDPDLVLGRLNGRPRGFFRNDAGSLTSVLEDLAPPNWDHALAWGDVDGDGDLDLVVGGGAGSPLTVYVQDGETLTPTTASLLIEEGVRGLDLADFDGDGDLDVAAAGGFTAGLLLGDGAGWFESTWTTTYEDRVFVAAWGDFDADGDPDAAFAGSGGHFIHRNDELVLVAHATLEAPEGGYAPHQLLWDDVDGDGDLDLLRAGLDFVVYEQDAGEFAPTWRAGLGGEVVSVDRVDLDDDGDLDFWLGREGWLHPAGADVVFLKEPGGLRLAWWTPWLERTNRACVADWDDDGELEVLSVVEGGNSIVEGRVAVHQFRRGLGDVPPGLGDEGEDTPADDDDDAGLDDDDAGADDDEGPDPAPADCGCSDGGGVAALGLLLLPARLRRAGVAA